MKFLLMIVTFLFLTQQANSKYLELDQMLIDRKIVDEKFEVKDLEKLESLIWYGFVAQTYL